MKELPAPLTPPDCDLRDFVFMPLDVVRLRDSDLAALESAEACWCAVLLWCASWHQLPAASLPNDDRILAQLAGFGKVLKEWLRIRDGALRGWIECSDGRLYHRVIASFANRAWEAKLVRMRKIDRRLQIESGEWAELRSAVFARDNYTCTYCGKRGARLEADHIIPVRHGGETSMGNLATACFSCNRSKGSKSLAEWRQ